MGFIDRIKNAWNAFFAKDTKEYPYNVMNYTRGNQGYISSVRPDKINFSRGNERSIITAIYNRIAIDCASNKIKHIRVDENDKFVENIESGLNKLLTFRANKDQSAREIIQDIVITMFDNGVAALVPVDTIRDQTTGTTKEIVTWRVGTITEWYPDAVKVELYNDRKGIREDIILPKEEVAIITNPLYAVINAPNSILQRLIRALNFLDAIDEQSASGKLDLIIQLPYVIKSEARREQAAKRRQDIEEQLTGTKYGIAYTDGTEKITQLNRPVENNAMERVTYLTEMLFTQLGVTQGILNGTAKPEEMSNYLSRTIEPIMSAICDAIEAKCITDTGRTQGQRIRFFNDPFRLIPITLIADIADKFTRNEIMSSNEVRAVIGLRPVDDPKADELRNKNINPGDVQEFASTKEETKNTEKENQNEETR